MDSSTQSDGITPLTNFERWRLYTAGLSSPQSYIDWTWIYTVCAALQRRVWIGPVHQPCYPNMYVVLVGPPGIGKGLAIRESSIMLRNWKLKDVINLKKPEMPAGVNGESMSSEDLERMKEQLEKQFREKEASLEQPLYPVAADATSYEALIQAIGGSYRYVSYLDSFGKTQAYGHSSICFTLQELSSLFRRKSDDTINFLLGMYDCPQDYEYSTISRGKDRIRRGCVSLLAGTTPSFMQSTFDSRLADEGFTSRTFFIYASRNRKNQFWIPALSKEQEDHKKHLLNHIRNLAGLYGSIEIDDDTRLYLQDWWDKYVSDKTRRANTSPKLAPYESRRNIHLMKVAMGLHFSESTLLKIPRHRFEEADAFLRREEKFMHLALTLEGNNQESQVLRRILEHLQSGPKNYVQIVAEVWKLLPNNKSIEEQLQFLQITGQVIQYEERDPTIDKTIIWYKLPTTTTQ